MQRSTRRRIEPFVRSIARAVFQVVEDEMASAQHVKRLEERLRKLEGEIRRQSRQLSRSVLATKRPRGRPRSNPETCTKRGCHEPARARTLCSTHYQQVRRAERARLARAS